MDQDRFDIEYVGSRLLADAMICGHIKSDKSICLDGTIRGNVDSAKSVIINKTGVVDGDVECNDLYLNGKITGNATVKGKAVLGGSAEIQGGLITAMLEITPGAKIRKGLKLKNASK